MIDIVNAAAALITLVLLGVTTAAALVQLEHLRDKNDLDAVLSVERDFRTPAIQAALLDAQNELPHRMEEPAYRAQLSAPGYLDPRQHPEMTLCNWFNRTGTLVRAGFLSEALFFDSFGRLVIYYWDLLAPVIAVLRRSRGDGQYNAFEFLAFRARRHRLGRKNRRRRHSVFPVTEPAWDVPSGVPTNGRPLDNGR
jgi:hypothetical protein